jgi:hypothetical protein
VLKGGSGAVLAGLAGSTVGADALGLGAPADAAEPTVAASGQVVSASSPTDRP